MIAYKIVPALYKLRSVNWTWVWLSELAEITNTTPLQCWRKFFHLAERNRVFVAFENEDGGEREFEDLSVEEAALVFVPAGWAMKALKEVAAGVTRSSGEYLIHDASGLFLQTGSTLSSITFADRGGAIISVSRDYVVRKARDLGLVLSL
jgi:hypothetical protein